MGVFLEKNTPMSSTVEHVSVVSSTNPPMAKDERQRPNGRSIIREFCLNTSAHAVPGIARSKSTHNRLFWSISFIGFTGTMIYFIVKAILLYFDYPTNMDLNIDNEWPQYFPAFSFCNAVAFRFDQFIVPFLNYTKAHNWTNSNDTTTWSSQEAVYIRHFVIDKINKNESLEPFSYSLPSLLYTCKFNGEQCSAKDFVPFLSSSYGLCYTFNAKMKNSNNNSVRYGNENGGSGELTLELYIHSHQYVPYIRDGIGIVALVHDNTQLPLIESASIHLIPGRKHKLGYRKKATFFLPSPYTTCTDQIQRPMQIMFENYRGADYAYSTAVCMQLCQQTYVYKQCGCVNPSLWNARSIVMPDTNKVIYAPLCNTADSCFRRAANILLASATLMTTYCSNCARQCSITDFIVQMSSLKVPAEWQLNGIKKFVENLTIPLAVNWSTTWREHISNNYLAVSVVRETTIVENNTQTSALGMVDVLSNIGGQTGLWIGISFLSLMEVIEMLYRLIRYQYNTVQLAVQTKMQIIQN